MACGNIGQYVDQVLTFCVLCICYFIEQMYRRVASALLPGLYSNFYGFQWWIHEFPGGCQPQRRGDDLLFGIFFAENCTKIKKTLKSVRITHADSLMVCKQYIVLNHVLSEKTTSFPKAHSQVPPRHFPSHFPQLFPSHFQQPFPTAFPTAFPKPFLEAGII